ncbi:MAG: hypothetical protein ABII85_01510 [Bacillota bacterium]
MAKGNKKSKDDLINVLEKKIKYLKWLISEINKLSYDDSFRVTQGNQLSVIIRDLAIDKGSSQTSLLTRLDIKKKLYFDAKIIPLSGPNNLVSESKLIKYILIQDKLYFFTNEPQKKISLIDFYYWLNEIVIDTKEPEDNLVTRREIILAVADMIAAHTDEHYEKKYDNICNFNALKFQAEYQGKFYNPINNPYSEILITIANELVEAYEFYIENKYSLVISKNLDERKCVLTKYNVNETNCGYRFQFWIDGNAPIAIWNRIHFDFKSKNIEGLFLSDVKGINFINKSRKTKTGMYYLNLNKDKRLDYYFNLTNNIFAVWVDSKENYELISGSQVGENNRLPEEMILLSEENYILRENISFKTKIDLFDSIGTPL